jgi:hypothetical protein
VIVRSDVSPKIMMQDIRSEDEGTVRRAVSTVDALVWGGRMHESVDFIYILKDSDGDPRDPPTLKGIADVYDAKLRKCTLNLAGLIAQGKDDQSNLAWSICHDLAHAFDVAHGNLEFDRELGVVVYRGRAYRIVQPANTRLPEDYVDRNKLLYMYRECKYYQGHEHYEPWETRALFAADACMADIRRSTGELPGCPNEVDYK